MDSTNKDNEVIDKATMDKPKSHTPYPFRYDSLI